MKESYNKLVRDHIPDIIRQQGDTALTKTLNDTEYFEALNEKLKEEVAEYIDGYDVEELADIIEVILALAAFRGISEEELTGIRLKKLDERGGFHERTVLVEVERKRI